jgi:hypothetical protein
MASQFVGTLCEAVGKIMRYELRLILMQPVFGNKLGEISAIYSPRDIVARRN